MGAAFSNYMIASINSLLPRFLLELVLVLFFVRILGRLLSYVRQPYVIGELIAGILLGPSVFGQIPGFTAFFFPAESQVFLELISEVALMFFMFFLGLEIQPEGIIATWKHSAPTAILSILCPFGLGILLAIWLYTIVHSLVSFGGFCLFIGLCMSFTAFPVLARILAEVKDGRAISSPLGDHVLSIAALDDIMAWTCMALVIGYATGAAQLIGLYIALLTIGFILFQTFVVRPFFVYTHKRLLSKDRELDNDFIILILLIMFLSAWVTECIGIHAFFGSFCVGLMVPKEGKIANHILPQLELLIVDIFVPLYFAYSGLRTNLALINTAKLFFTAILITVVATIGKAIPPILLYKWFGHGWPFAFTMGVLLNTRGMVSLIAANIGLSAKVIDTQLFSMLVIMNLLTTCLTPPIFYIIYEKYLMDDKDPDLQARDVSPEDLEAGRVSGTPEPLANEDFYNSPEESEKGKKDKEKSNIRSINEEGIPLSERNQLREPLSPQKSLKSDANLTRHEKAQEAKMNSHIQNMPQEELYRLARLANAIEAGQKGKGNGGSHYTYSQSGTHYHSRTIRSVNFKW